MYRTFFRPPRARIFNPTRGAYGDNLLAWLSAEQFADATDSSSISTAQDWSRNRRTWTQTGTERPVVTLNSLNGRPGITFTAASSQHLIGSSGMASALDGEDIPWTMVLTCTPTTDNTNYIPWALGNSGDPDSEIAFNLSAATRYVSRKEDDAGTLDLNQSSAGVTSATAQTAVIVDTGTSSLLRKNGVEVLSASGADVGAITFDTFFVGARAQGGTDAAHFDGVIYDLQVYSTNLSAAQVARVESDLSARYGHF